MNPAYKSQPASGRYRYKTDESRIGQIGRNCRATKTPRALSHLPEAAWVMLEAPAITTVETWEQARTSCTETGRG